MERPCSRLRSWDTAVWLPAGSGHEGRSGAASRWGPASSAPRDGCPWLPKARASGQRMPPCSLLFQLCPAKAGALCPTVHLTLSMSVCLSVSLTHTHTRSEKSTKTMRIFLFFFFLWV